MVALSFEMMRDKSYDNRHERLLEPQFCHARRLCASFLIVYDMLLALDNFTKTGDKYVGEISDFDIKGVPKSFDVKIDDNMVNVRHFNTIYIGDDVGGWEYCGFYGDKRILITLFND